MRSFMLEQNVTYGAPEIAPVRGEGTLVVGFDISLFRGLDVLQGFGCLLIVIERREQPRLHADMQFLHFRGVHPEILPAQRPHTHQFQLPLQDIDDHRQLVQPTAAQFAPPIIDPVIMGEFPAFLQSLMLQDIGLQILRIGIHRAELVNTDHIPMVSDPVQFDQCAIGRVVVPDGFPELLSEDEILTLMETLVHDFEPSPVHPAQQFHAAVAPVLSLGDPHIEPTGDLHPGTHPVPAIMHQIQHLADQTGMRP